MPPKLSEVPHRVQRQRIKGWRMPPHTVYVGRPTKWGNPFDTAAAFQYMLSDNVSLADTIRVGARMKCNLSDIVELQGKNLACWCPLSQPCHADILLEVANAPE